MAMKVLKTTVYRLTVSMSCGCRMSTEFRDARYKEPVNAPEKLEEGQEFGEFIERGFTPCDKHKKDAALSTLEFIIGERLDEAIEEAQKTPVAAALSPLAQQLDANGNGIAVGAEGAQSMGMGTRLPRRDPTKIKQVRMSASQNAGKVPATKGMDIDMEGVEEDERVTSLTDNTLGFLMDDVEEDNSR